MFKLRLQKTAPAAPVITSRSNPAIQRSSRSVKQFSRPRRDARTSAAPARGEAVAPLDGDVPQPELVKSCTIEFCLTHQTWVGESVVVVGSTPELGEWVVETGLKLKWTPGHKWRGSVTVPLGAQLNYKFAILSKKGCTWERSKDRVLTAPDMSDGPISVNAKWQKPALVIATPPVDASALGKTYKAEIAIQKELFLGEYLKVVGNVEVLGEWDHHEALTMEWSEHHIWTATVELPVGELVEFKIVQSNHALPDQCHWQAGENMIIDAPEIGVTSDDLLEIGCDWSGEARARVSARPPPPKSALSIITPSGHTIESAVDPNQDEADDEQARSVQLDDTPVTTSSESQSDEKVVGAVSAFASARAILKQQLASLENALAAPAFVRPAESSKNGEAAVNAQSAIDAAKFAAEAEIVAGEATAEDREKEGAAAEKSLNDPVVPAVEEAREASDSVDTVDEARQASDAVETVQKAREASDSVDTVKEAREASDNVEEASDSVDAVDDVVDVVDVPVGVQEAKTITLKPRGELIIGFDEDKAAVEALSAQLWSTQTSSTGEIMFTAEQLDLLTRQGFANSILYPSTVTAQEGTIRLKRGRLATDEDGDTVIVPGGHMYDTSTGTVRLSSKKEVVAEEKELSDAAAEGSPDKAKYAVAAAVGMGVMGAMGGMLDMDLIVLGTMFAAGSAVAKAQNVDIKSKGGAGPAYSVLMAAADVAKKVKSFSRAVDSTVGSGSTKQVSGAKAVAKAIATRKAAVAVAKEAASSAETSSKETPAAPAAPRSQQPVRRSSKAKNLKGSKRALEVTAQMTKMTNSLGPGGIEALVAGAANVDVTPVLQTVDTRLSEINQIKQLVNKLAGFECNTSDLRVQAAQQLTAAHVTSECSSVLLAALTVAALNSEIGLIQLDSDDEN